MNGYGAGRGVSHSVWRAHPSIRSASSTRLNFVSANSTHTQHNIVRTMGGGRISQQHTIQGERWAKQRSLDGTLAPNIHFITSGVIRLYIIVCVSFPNKKNLPKITLGGASLQKCLGYTLQQKFLHSHLLAETEDVNIRQTRNK